jgi:hypothetical protein
MTPIETHAIAGGVQWATVAAGVGIVAAAVAIVGTAGLATIPLAVFGAATAGEIVVAGASVTAAAAGGVAIGDGLTS